MQRKDLSNLQFLYENSILKAPVKIKDIAIKHNVTEDEVNKQLKIGTSVELEHTKDHLTAQTIASQHLEEDIDYYKKLKKIEK